MDKIQFPKFKYHPEKDLVVIKDESEEKKLGHGWVDSPADFGVETHPGLKPDPIIAAKKPKIKSDSRSVKKSGAQ